MRKISLILFVLVLVGNVCYAQFKDIPYETKEKLKNNNLILGFINPKNFSWSSSINMSFQTFGSGSASIASYTGTLGYKILNNLNVSADITMQYSPYATLGSSIGSVNKDFQNSLNGVYLSRLALDYQPFKNTFLHIEYDNLKNNYNWPYYFNGLSRWGYY